MEGAFPVGTSIGGRSSAPRTDPGGPARRRAPAGPPGAGPFARSPRGPYAPRSGASP